MSLSKKYTVNVKLASQNTGISVSSTSVSSRQVAAVGLLTGPRGLQGDPGTTDYTQLTNKPTLGSAAAADIGDFATAAQGTLADTAMQSSGGTFTGPVNMGSQVLEGLPVPSGSTEAATKGYVDTAVSGATIPDASSLVKGKLKLTGDLGGTADSPTVPGLAGKEPSITAGTTGQYWRGDKSWQTLDKSAVGLSNVDNTSDTNKPISTATQSALDLKAPLVSPALTGTPTAPTASAGTNTTQIATTAYVRGEVSALKPVIGTTASSATPTIDVDVYDQYNITALAAAITGITVTGTPADGQKLLLRIKDNGTARAITHGASFVSGPGTLLTTTVISKTHFESFVYDSVAAKWVCMAADAAGY